MTDPWTCGHTAGAVCAECHRLLAAKAAELQAEVDMLRDLIVGTAVRELPADLHDWRDRLRVAWTLARLVEPLPLAAMIEKAEHAETMGPFLDPTSWMRNRDAFIQDLRVLRALRDVQTALGAIKAEHEARQAKRAARSTAS